MLLGNTVLRVLLALLMARAMKHPATLSRFVSRVLTLPLTAAEMETTRKKSRAQLRRMMRRRAAIVKRKELAQIAPLPGNLSHGVIDGIRCKGGHIVYYLNNALRARSTLLKGA